MVSKIHPEQTAFSAVYGLAEGWLRVDYDGAEFDASFFFTVTEAFASAASILLTNVPIGFLDLGIFDRRCDQVARNVLGRKCHRINPVPCRGAIYAYNIEDANEINLQRCGESIRSEVRRLIPRMRELDEFLSSEAYELSGKLFYEVNAEISFWSFNHLKVIESEPNTISGQKERLNLLEAKLPSFSNFAHSLVLSATIPGLSLLNMVEIGAIIMTGLNLPNLSQMPQEPNFDSRGRSMSIVTAA